jgi:hypothetical protein
MGLNNNIQTITTSLRWDGLDYSRWDVLAGTHKLHSINKLHSIIYFSNLNILMMIILTRPGAGLPEEGGVNEAHYRINEPLWCTTGRDRVSKELFDDMQFITCDEQESYGSEWQQEVCERAGINQHGMDYVKAFWQRKGRVLARKTLNRRRQNTNTAMKRMFLGKQ